MARARELLEEITRYGSETSSILSGVAIPEGRTQLRVSGTLLLAITPDAEGVERFGGMATQASSLLDGIEATLAETEPGPEDVAFLQVHLVADLASGEVGYGGFCGA